MTIDDKTIDELRKLYAKATPGPWRVNANTVGAGELYSVEADADQYIAAGEVAFTYTIHNARLIVAEHNALPGLLDEIKRLRGQLVLAAALKSSTLLDKWRQAGSQIARAASLVERKK
jgi:hypothetical protein